MRSTRGSIHRLPACYWRECIELFLLHITRMMRKSRLQLACTNPAGHTLQMSVHHRDKSTVADCTPSLLSSPSPSPLCHIFFLHLDYKTWAAWEGKKWANCDGARTVKHTFPWAVITSGVLIKNNKFSHFMPSYATPWIAPRNRWAGNRENLSQSRLTRKWLWRFYSKF